MRRRNSARAVLVLAAWLYARFDASRPGLQFATALPWIPGWGVYYRIGHFSLRHRWGVFAGSLGVLAVGWLFMSKLHPQYFPKDLSYLSYVDVWVPPDAPLGATNAVAHRAETR